MECIYDVTLINRSPQLDLRIESGKIASVIRETLDLRPEVTRCDVVQIDQHGMVLSVEETGTFWHGVIGRKIANDHGMRLYRSPEHLSQMFHWARRSPSEPTQPDVIDPQDAST